MYDILAVGMLATASLASSAVEGQFDLGLVQEGEIQKTNKVNKQITVITITKMAVIVNIN